MFMLYRVALALNKTVKELTDAMDLREYAHWVAFFKLHGFPDMRQEFYGAQLASLILSVVSSKGKKYKINDFMLDEILTTKSAKAEQNLMNHLDAIIAMQENAST